MNQFKRAQVMMLPTNKESILCLNIIIGLSLTKPMISVIPEFINQHLYIISDDEIKDGDYYLFENKIYKCTGDWAGKKQYQLNALKYDFHKGEYCKKIIATTDTSLTEDIYKKIDGFERFVEYGSPQPSQQFIEKYIESYNKGEVITDVLVEYENYTKGNLYGNPMMIKPEVLNKLKINSKDNTITIKKLKDSWNREEVIKLLEDYSVFDDGTVTTRNNFIKRFL